MKGTKLMAQGSSSIMMETMKASILSKSMEKADMSGLMAQNTEESGMKIRSMAWELIHGRMVDNIKDSGKIIKWTA